MEKPADMPSEYQPLQPSDLVSGLQAYLAKVATTAWQQRHASRMFGIGSLSSNPLYRIDPEEQFVESITGSLSQFESVRQTLGEHGLTLAIQRLQTPEDRQIPLLHVAGIAFDAERYQFMAAAHEPQQPNSQTMMFSMQPEYIPIVGNNLSYVEQSDTEHQ